MVDLDRFKEINDTLGHHAGDVLLGELGRRLLAVVRGEDFVARLGGDEFAIVLTGLNSPTDAEDVARRVRDAIERPFSFDGLTLHISSSVGIAFYPEHGDTSSVLLQRADVAMYSAKVDHVGCALYAPADDHHSRDRLAFVGELRSALEKDELVVFYQPKADIQTGRVIGVEALVRWQHPDRGLLAPAQFLPTAAQSGLIRDLTLYVLDRALAQNAAWESEGLRLGVAVNLAVANLVDLSLPEEVERRLKRWRVPADRLQLEITENLLLADPARAERVLDELHDLGIRMSLDDFGTGYSSLAFLRRLPVDEIKIDRSFVQDMTEDRDSEAIVASTIGLARSLDLRVVAEGVETREAWQRLGALGAHEAQGFLLSKPKPAEELTDWLKSRAAGDPSGVAPLGDELGSAGPIDRLTRF